MCSGIWFFLSFEPFWLNFVDDEGGVSFSSTRTHRHSRTTVQKPVLSSRTRRWQSAGCAQCGPISGFCCAPRLYVIFPPSQFKIFIRLFLNKNCSYLRCSVRRFDTHTTNSVMIAMVELMDTPVSSYGFLLFCLFFFVVRAPDIYLFVIFVFKTVLLVTVATLYTHRCVLIHPR